MWSVPVTKLISVKSNPERIACQIPGPCVFVVLKPSCGALCWWDSAARIHSVSRRAEVIPVGGAVSVALPRPPLWPHGLEPARLPYAGGSPGKNTAVGCHSLLRAIFLTQGSNPHLLCLLHWQVGSLPGEPRAREGDFPAGGGGADFGSQRPLCLCLQNPLDAGAWRAAVPRVTRLGTAEES